MTVPPTGPDLRVMLVEDHRLVRDAIRRTLDVPGIRVVAEASSAEEALAIVMGHRPDVILLDIDLPGMSGVELVRELSPRLPDTHIVMLTGSTVGKTYRFRVKARDWAGNRSTWSTAVTVKP